jgi:hypothetical protein
MMFGTVTHPVLLPGAQMVTLTYAVFIAGRCADGPAFATRATVFATGGGGVVPPLDDDEPHAAAETRTPVAATATANLIDGLT